MMLGLVLTSLFGVFPWVADNAAVVTTPQVEMSLRMEPAAADGRARAMLLFDLAPGWKTYWFDPGAVGIAPMIDSSLSSGVEITAIGAPLPLRFVEEGGEAVGYDKAMAFAFDVTIDPEVYRPELRIDLSFGLCREVCVPMSASLAARPDAKGEEAVSIDEAFGRLPQAVTGLIDVELEGDALTVDVPAGVSDVFVHREGWSFGRAVKVEGERFIVPVLATPSTTRNAVGGIAVAQTADGAIIETIAPSAWERWRP